MAAGRNTSEDAGIFNGAEMLEVNIRHCPMLLLPSEVEHWLLHISAGGFLAHVCVIMRIISYCLIISASIRHSSINGYQRMTSRRDRQSWRTEPQRSGASLQHIEVQMRSSIDSLPCAELFFCYPPAERDIIKTGAVHRSVPESQEILQDFYGLTVHHFM